MAKEQIAVAELITNIILGKTDGASRVDFFPQKPKFPFDKPYEQPFPEQHRKARAFAPICWRICSVIWWLPTIQTCIISWFFETGKSSAKPTSRLIAAESACHPFHVQKHHRNGYRTSCRRGQAFPGRKYL